MDPVNVVAKFEVRSLPVPEIIAIGDLEFWVRIANPDLREGEAVGGRDGTVRKSVSEFL